MPLLKSEKSIKRTVIIISAFLLLNVPLASVSNQGFCQAVHKPLWEITSKTNSVFLLGSIHLLNKASYPLDESFEKAYLKSQAIVFEADIGKMSSPAIQQRMMRESLLPPGQTLRDVLSQETYQLLAKRMSQSGLPMASFMRFKPWMCALTLTLTEVQKLGFSPQYGIDNYFYKKARADQKTIIALESVDDQLNLFFDLDNKEQEKMLKKTISEIKIIQQFSSDMVTYWKTGDSQKLGDLIQKSFAGQPEIHKKFIIDRNKRWLPTIAGLIGKQESALVIVGAGHLVGDQNILDFLKKKGYRVTQKY